MWNLTRDHTSLEVLSKFYYSYYSSHSTDPTRQHTTQLAIKPPLNITKGEIKKKFHDYSIVPRSDQTKAKHLHKSSSKQHKENFL